MWFHGAYIATMGGWDKDRATRVSSLTNEEPSVVVEAGINIAREIVGKDRGNSRDGMIREGETSLRCGRYGSVRQRTSGAEDRHRGCGWGVGSHRGPEVFALGGSNEDVVGVDGDIFVERGEEESVEYFLGYTGRRGRHG